MTFYSTVLFALKCINEILLLNMGDWHYGYDGYCTVI